MKKFLSNTLSVLWFLGVVLGLIILLPLVILLGFSFFSGTINSGFASPAMITPILAVCGLAFGITMIVPVFRRCFRKLPWLYTYITVLMMDLVILAIAESILNYGYAVYDDTRHMIFKILMILQIIICRAAMCLYYHFKRKREGGNNSL